MQQPQVHFIGGEKGGVGKSVVARLLAQYWIDTAKDWQGYDTDRSHGALLRYYADYSQPVEISKVEQVDRIMETALEQQRHVLVDLAAQTEAQLHRWVDDADLLAMARDTGLKLYFWYVMDEGKDSVNLLQGLLDRYGNSANIVVVLNHGRGEDFSLFHDSPTAEQVQALGIPVIELRALHRPTMRKIDQFDKSFWAAVNNTDPSLGECLGVMERQRIKAWLKNAYQAFEQVGA